MRTLFVYTAGRLLVLGVLFLLLWLLGLGGIALPLLAVLLSMPVSYLLLARQRDALAANLEQRLTARRDRRDRFRARLRGEPPADSQPGSSGTSGTGSTGSTGTDRAAGDAQ